MLHFFLANEMIVPGLPAIGIGRDIGDVMKDDEGIARAKSLGQTMAQLTKHLSRNPLPERRPAQADDRMTKKMK
jgi:hypothetical protein